MSNQICATSESGEIHPMPKRRERIAFHRTFSPKETAKIGQGCVPQEMEDKWLVYFENSWLAFHRSWTGHCVFRVKIQQDADGSHVVEAWANRDASQYKSSGSDEDLKLLSSVFRSVLGV